MKRLLLCTLLVCLPAFAQFARQDWTRNADGTLSPKGGRSLSVGVACPGGYPAGSICFNGGLYGSGSNLTGIGGGVMVYPGAGVPRSTGSAWTTSYTVGTLANNLVQLDSGAKLPAVDGSQLTNLPAGMVYPGAGVPRSTGSAWGTSYTVGTSANNLVQLDGTGKLPAVDGSQLTGLAGGGTVTVVSAGSLTSTALVTGGGTTTLQTPSSSATMDASGNISTPGTVTTGAGGSAAGVVTANRASATAGTVVLQGANSGAATITPTDAATVTVTLPAISGTVPVTIASGTTAMPVGALSANTCSASATTATATGALTTDTITATYAADPTGVTGYGAGTSGGITVRYWATANTVNFKLCNESGGSITPGALSVNWRITR